MTEVYYIGGSPCSGKSTITEILAKKYQLYYFKVDDFLEDFIEKAAKSGKPICRKYQHMTPEETWMRLPEVQNEEELECYREMLFCIEDKLEELKKQQGIRGIITEAAAYLPELMKAKGIPQNRYLCVTPTAEFQVEHYRKREWVPYVLEGCKDKEKAFENWMKRDILFAESVRKQCTEAGYRSIVNDGSVSIEAMTEEVRKHFEL